jgi:hypothetical protein
MNFFITGTDTGVGKTHLTRLMVESLRAEGRDAAGFKPVSCGDRDDGRILAEVSGNLPLDDVNPLHFASPVAPYVAALLENKSIDPTTLVESYRKFSEGRGTVLVEGAGGCKQVEDRVIGVLALVDRVSEAAATPPVGVAVDGAAHAGDARRDGLEPTVGGILVEFAADDDHQFVGTDFPRHVV